MSEVIWVDSEKIHIDNSVRHKLQRLMDSSRAESDLIKGMRVALKINTAEEGYDYGLRPGFFRPVSERVLAATNTRPVICDGIKLADYWKKIRGTNYLKMASAQGYSNETLGGHFVINGGFSGDEGDLFPCRLKDSELGGVEVGTAVCRSDALWVLTHVTFHPLFGISGALFNGGFDCMVTRAKTRLLKSINPYIFNGHKPPFSDLRAFQYRALESFLGVQASVENKMFFINYLWDMTPQPEYYPYSEKPVIENLGFLASRDPVAIDQATVDLIGKKCSSEVLTGGGINFIDVLQDAERMGIGSLDYTLNRLS
ncbi:MAG: DUF362 domain-containing protein [Desulfobacterales bacterium]|nr:DUF362 domain-containing protein [Desulfobacterales bacterium]